MLKDKLMTELKSAMKTGYTLKKDLLKMLRNDLLVAEKEKGDVLTELEETLIVQRELKKQKEALQASIKADRKDLVDLNKVKISLLQVYLPDDMMSKEEIHKVLSATCRENGYLGRKVNIGLLVGSFMKQYKGKAEGKEVKEIAEEVIKEEATRVARDIINGYDPYWDEKIPLIVEATANYVPEEKNHVEKLFENHVPSESDKVDFDWGDPRGHELF